MCLQGETIKKLILFNKPYGVVCQFSKKDNESSLADFIDFKNFYPAGRLDKDSEGLVLLTDDGKLQNRITNPKCKLGKKYWVQVEGLPSNHQIKQLSEGVYLDNQKTLPAIVKKINEPSVLWQRDPPVRFRKNIPTSWLLITIFEGRNRQIRRMTAKVGLPTLRLVRIGIGKYDLDNLKIGQLKSVKVINSYLNNL